VKKVNLRSNLVEISSAFLFNARNVSKAKVMIAGSTYNNTDKGAIVFLLTAP
jgi:hypothetical protein